MYVDIYYSYFEAKQIYFLSFTFVLGHMYYSDDYQSVTSSSNTALPKKPDHHLT